MSPVQDDGADSKYQDLTCSYHAIMAVGISDYDNIVKSSGQCNVGPTL